ncbi:MAG: hypothetical protein H0V89_08695, partial [Deltaproteobacteria bacterium]|nr:hypothetical protein [Deltaproteobacteria bacterium]
MVDSRWFAIATVVNYALLTVLWAVILVMYVRYRRLARAMDPLVAVLAAVLALDAFKNFVENFYFGLVWAGRYGIAFTSLAPTLSAPW